MIDRARAAARRRDRQSARPPSPRLRRRLRGPRHRYAGGGTRSTLPTPRSPLRCCCCSAGAACPALGGMRRVTPDGAGPTGRHDPRHARSPSGAARARVDRVVADLTGLSRSYVQKLIVDRRADSGRHGPRAARERPRGARRARCASSSRRRRPSTSSRRTIDVAGRLRGRRPADRRQAVRPRRSSVAGSRGRDARECAARPRHRVRRHRRRPAARGSCTASIATPAAC